MRFFLLSLLVFNAQLIAAQKVVIGFASNFSAMSDNMWNPYANYFRNGVNLALADQASELRKHGLEIELLPLDYGNDKTAARKVALDAVSSKAIAVIGLPYSSEVLLTADIFNQNHLLLLSPSTTADPIGSLGRYIRTCTFNDTFQGQLLAKAATQQQAKTAAIISIADCAYCQSLRNAFRKGFEQQGGKIIIDESFLESEVTSAESITKIKTALASRNLDAIFIPNYERVSSTQIASLYDAGIHPKIWLGGDGWGTMSDLFLQIIANRPIEALTLGHWHREEKTPGNSAFTKKFTKKYGKEPNDIAAISYDAMALLIKAVIEAKAKDRNGIVEAIEKIKRFNGVTGPMVYNDQRIPAKEAVLLQLKNGKVRWLKTISQ